MVVGYECRVGIGWKGNGIMKKRMGLVMAIVVSAMLGGTTLADTESPAKSLSNPQSPPPPIVQNAGDTPNPTPGLCSNC